MGKLRSKIKNSSELKKRLLPAGIQPDGKVFLSSAEAGEYLVSKYGKLDHEIIVLLFFKNNYLVSEKTVSGNSRDVSASIREITAGYRIACADSLIIAHNHPSGIALPSEQDKFAFDELLKYFSFNKISLYDNIIFEGIDFISYRESGLIRKGDD